MNHRPPQPKTALYARLTHNTAALKPYYCHTAPDGTMQPWEKCRSLAETSAKEPALSKTPAKQSFILQNWLQEWISLNCINATQDLPLEFCHTKFQQTLPHSRQTAQPTFDFRQAYWAIQEQMNPEQS